MVNGEETLIEELQQLKRAAQRDCQSWSPQAQAEDWLPTYLRWVDRKLCDVIELGHQYADEYKQCRSAQNKELLHAIRRKAAILHQEIDLLDQGLDAYDTATRYCETVGGGRWYVVNHFLTLQ